MPLHCSSSNRQKREWDTAHGLFTAIDLSCFLHIAITRLLLKRNKQNNWHEVFRRCYWRHTPFPYFYGGKSRVSEKIQCKHHSIISLGSMYISGHEPIDISPYTKHISITPKNRLLFKFVNDAHAKLHHAWHTWQATITQTII